ncbi:hypothetical protein NDU88_003087 [Pleurodeles waltl]|uniref:Uncharacterized protein n=1 Tax=Pleurodeles waltl TaxID=8319 RepID=A0AAV7T3S0_PLEWA|nr:hypothetical protein NDU88_003087 [Pleurodeles waltl]
MEEQIIKIEQLTKDLEKISNQQEVSNQLAKMEERIKYKEDEIKSRKAHTFNRDKLDYEHGRWDYVNTRIELYKYVRKLRLIKHFSNKDINRMAENIDMRAMASGFSIVDSPQLIAINELANDSNEVGCSSHDDVNNSTTTIN